VILIIVPPFGFLVVAIWSIVRLATAITMSRRDYRDRLSPTDHRIATLPADQNTAFSDFAKGGARRIFNVDHVRHTVNKKNKTIDNKATGVIIK